MKRKGFTMIEVTLVLAIAGLIFIMVFITLPSVWRNQRDAARRDDMLTFVQKLKNFQSNNNRGALPSGTGEVSYNKNSSAGVNTWEGFYRDFFDDTFADPVGEPYKLVVTECSPGVGGASTWDAECVGTAVEASTLTSLNYKIYIVIGAKCSGNEKKPVVGSANTRKVAVVYKLEGGGVYCGES